MENKQYYIWENEVKKIDWNKVEFVDWTVMEFTDKELLYLLQEEPCDEAQVKSNLIRNIVPEMTGLLVDYNVRKWDLTPIIECIVETFNQNFNKAIWIAFWTYEKGLHSAYFVENIKISDIYTKIENNIEND